MWSVVKVYSNREVTVCKVSYSDGFIGVFSVVMIDIEVSRCEIHEYRKYFYSEPLHLSDT